jgi:hypothetical protein
VRIDAGVETCSYSRLFNNPPKMGSGEATTVIAEKYFSS